jgi:hypothetical protein
MRTIPTKSLLLLATFMMASGIPAAAQLSRDTTQSTQPESGATPTVTATAASDPAVGRGGVAQEGTGKDNFDPERLKIIEGEIDAVEADFNKLEKEKTELLSVRIFSRGNDRGLDFEKHHNEMLQVFTETAKLLNQFQLVSGRSTAALAQLVPIKGKGLKPEEDNRLQGVKNRSNGVQALINKSLAEVAAYRAEMNNQLIEDVHRYQIKNSFRSQVGIAWLLVFLVLCVGLIYLLKTGVLSASEPSTVQFVAMILIIFVIVLFGIADVMGENGVTGLLAALAGYILGKSTKGGQESNVADIIAALQGHNLPKKPPAADAPGSEGKP